ncbi:hypothetical protein M5D96_002143 [Drosophila gunungcola]|uniref:DUF4806 domain-containing protein n=1 Tax=Drosophila gunungcola TaxID=103775 RepID=A0A9Q0BVD3_9MUSC|nr:hypothetical protein M5D96_002143 [Drosophila gunungcola]
MKCFADYDQQELTTEERIISVIRAENQELKGSLEKLKINVTLLSEAVAFQTELIKELLNRQQNNVTKEISTFSFPLQTEEDLFLIDRDMTLDAQIIYVNEMKNIFSQATLSKSLKNVLAEELVLEFNIDGVQNKKACARTKNFSLPLKIVRLTDGTQSAEKALRKAKHCVKNNACKRKMKTGKTK